MQSKHRILAVDDDRVILAIVEEIFGEEYDLATATCGEDAVELAPEWRPEVVLLDRTMPGIDGHETCRRLRALPATRNAKIVLVSARSMLSDRMLGYDSGADDFIAKPFDPAELLAKVKVLLRLHAVETVDQLKLRFLNLLAHETRTPLSSIVGPANLIEHDADNGDDARAYARMILDSASHLQTIVDRALLLCTFRVGQAHLAADDFDLADLVRTVALKTARLVERSDENLELDLPDALPWRGDPGHLAMVVESIVHNAFDHKHHGTEVTVRVLDDERGARIEVVDRGRGIAPEDVRRLFDGFDVNDIDQHGGHLGLSLAVSHEIVQQHSGAIEVASVPGEGSTFSVVLPRLPHAGETASAPSLVTTS